MAELNLLAELDEMDCWCGKDTEECREDGGCRWSNEIHAQGEKIGRLRLQVASLGSQIDAANATIACSRDALATFDGRGVNNFDIPTPGEVLDAWRSSLAEPTQQGDRDLG